LAEWIWPEAWQTNSDRLLLGNGASELIDLVIRSAPQGSWKAGPWDVQVCYRSLEVARKECHCQLENTVEESSVGLVGSALRSALGGGIPDILFFFLCPLVRCVFHSFGEGEEGGGGSIDCIFFFFLDGSVERDGCILVFLFFCMWKLDCEKLKSNRQEEKVRLFGAGKKICI
jgi:hypothetical protein